MAYYGEGSRCSQWTELDVKTSCHKRSKSFPSRSDLAEDKPDRSADSSHLLNLDISQPNRAANSKRKPSSNAQVQSSLRREILQLEKRLQNHIAVRCALEKALGYRSSSLNISSEISMPKPATELIRELSILELEVAHLEHYVLSLYRQAFDQQISSLSPPTKDDRSNSPLPTPRRRQLDFSKSDIVSKRKNVAVQAESRDVASMHHESNAIHEVNVLHSGAPRCHSSLSQHPGRANRSSTPAESLEQDLRAFHSQPLPMMEYSENTSSNIISLAEHLGTRISDHIQDTPNKISEDMIKCMSAIYCKLSDPPLTNNGLSSPTSSLSSTGAFSPKGPGNMWSPGFRDDTCFDVRLDNPYHVEGLKEFSGPYSTMVEIQCIYRGTKKLGEIEHLLQNFRLLISRLEEMDPRKLTHEEKLAFWINIHNALVMHAFLAYGIPQNNVKRGFLLLKAAYNVGGCVVNADNIQSSILGCRISRPGQWLRILLSSRTKLKGGDGRQMYAIERPEPLLHFALCSGSHSDPAVRLYTPKRVLQDLENAKEEYIRATFGVGKNKKILLSKVIDSFAKDSGLCPAGVMEMIQQSLPDSLRKSVKRCQQVKSRKDIEWLPHNLTFRYLIVKELLVK